MIVGTLRFNVCRDGGGRGGLAKVESDNANATLSCSCRFTQTLSTVKLTGDDRIVTSSQITIPCG